MIAKLYIRSRMFSNFCYPREARLIEWIKEYEDKNDIINIDEIKAELCEDAEGKKEEETPPLIYIVVASELKMFETSYDDSKELDPLKQGDRLTEISRWSRKSCNGTTKWNIKSGDVEGWITLPANSKKRNTVILSANKKRPDKLVPKGWVYERDFKGELEIYSRKFFAVLQKISTNFQGKHAISLNFTKS